MNLVVKFMEVQGNEVRARLFIDDEEIAEQWFKATVNGSELEVDLSEFLRESEYEAEVQEARVIISPADTGSNARGKSSDSDGKGKVGRSTSKGVPKK